jgi:hypothetical protein
MTSEVVVMNRLAVALAADSAVTVRRGRRNKVWNSGNKLFMLSRRHPVGVMVYANPSLLGVPWETIIKIFRRQLGSTEFDHLTEYGKAFIEFLTDNEELFPAGLQDRYYLVLIEEAFARIAERIETKLPAIDTVLMEQASGAAAREQLRATVRTEIFSERDAWAQKQDATCYPPQTGQNLAGRFSGEVSDRIVKAFGHWQVGQEEMEALRQIAIYLISKSDIPASARSGVVIAGFGRREPFPRMQRYRIGEVYDGKPKVDGGDVVEIGEDQPAHVEAFADAEMTNLFLRGLNPPFERQLVRWVYSLLVGATDAVVEASPKLSGPARISLLERLVGPREDLMLAFLEQLEAHRKRQHLEPLHDAITHLPKDELAHVASSLVNLNLFKKRMSLALETVGGPVDVAVISKGDGFIWIERKHYFDKDLNPQYFRNLDLASYDDTGGNTHGQVKHRETPKPAISGGGRSSLRKPSETRRRKSPSSKGE